MDLIDALKELAAYGWSLNVSIRSLFGEESLWRDFFGMAKILAVAFIIITPFELLMPLRRGKSFYREGFWTDIAHHFVTNVIFKYLTLAVGVGFLYVLIEAYLPLEGIRAAIRSQPTWLQVIQALLVADFIRYWMHRAMHEVPFLWRIHACHHSPRQMDILATNRVHPFDVTSRKIAADGMVLALGFSISAYFWVFLIFSFWGYFQHANIRLDRDSLLGRILWPLRWIIATPRFHHWHHAYEVHNVNHGLTFAFWDVLFGTAYYPDDASYPKSYGIPEAHPKSWALQMVYPVLPVSWQRAMIRWEQGEEALHEHEKQDTAQSEGQGLLSAGAAAPLNEGVIARRDSSV